MPSKDRVVRRLRVIMPVVAVIITIVVAPLDLVPAWIAPLPDTVQEQLEAAVDHGLDGIIVYVDQAGRPAQLYAAGWKNKATQEPADPHALFRIASISKLYLAAAVAKLASRQTLSLDKSLVDYLPELADRVAYADQITLRMLVQHRSGIVNFTDTPEWDWFAPLVDPDQALGLVLDKPADFEPDDAYAYSNTNYLLIGRILDQALGYSHHQYIAEEILAPLGLSHTHSLLRDVDCDAVASGYWYGYDDDLRRLDHVIPGGSMIATAEDVGVFLRALNDATLLDPQEQAVYASIYRTEHDGWLPGFHSIARYHEDSDMVVVQFVSTTGGDTWGIANVIGGKATAVSLIVYNRLVRILQSD